MICYALIFENRRTNTNKLKVKIFIGTSSSQKITQRIIINYKCSANRLGPLLTRFFKLNSPIFPIYALLHGGGNFFQ